MDEDVVRALYEALRRRDLTAAVRLLHPSCVARTCSGLPEVGGLVVRGPDEWVARMWAPIHRSFDVTAKPEQVLRTEGPVVVIGSYHGVARTTGRRFEAWFTHLWTVDGGRLTGLRQVTDTVQWVRALAPAD